MRWRLIWSISFSICYADGKALVAMVLLGAVLGSAFYIVKTTKAANAAVEELSAG